jgi:YbbR domain-containing protein
LTQYPQNQIDISGMTVDGTVALTVLLPEGVELAKANTNLTAGVSIQETIVKVFQYNAEEIILEGLTKGKSVNTDITMIEVTISGRKEFVNPLTPDQLELYIDVSELELGTQTVEVMVSYDVPLHMITLNPKEIEITLLETQQEN